MFIVFDASAAWGHAAVTRTEIGARVVAWWLTMRTGRFHDYTPDHKPFARLRLASRGGR